MELLVCLVDLPPGPALSPTLELAPWKGPAFRHDPTKWHCPSSWSWTKPLHIQIHNWTIKTCLSIYIIYVRIYHTWISWIWFQLYGNLWSHHGWAGALSAKITLQWADPGLVTPTRNISADPKWHEWFQNSALPLPPWLLLPAPVLIRKPKAIQTKNTIETQKPPSCIVKMTLTAYRFLLAV